MRSLAPVKNKKAPPLGGELLFFRRSHATLQHNVSFSRILRMSNELAVCRVSRVSIAESAMAKSVNPFLRTLELMFPEVHRD